MNENIPAAAAPVEKLAYSAQEACAALGISRITLWRLEKLGVIQAVPHLRHKRFPVSSLRRFVESRPSRA